MSVSKGNCMMLEQLLAQLDVVKTLNKADVPISAVTDDSRQVNWGTLFVAVTGEKADGHRFIPQAVARDAAAVVCERPPADLPPCPVVRVRDSRLALSAVGDAFCGHPAQDLCVIGVTGTDGKTTTVSLIQAALEAAGRPTGLLGTVEYDLGAESLDSDQTTPHPLVLHAMLSNMRQAGLTHMVMEVSSHSLVHRRTAHVPFRVAALTNVTEDHLDFHGSLESYVRAKLMLFEDLPPEGVAVLNADSPLCERFREAVPAHATTLTYGMVNLADVSLEERHAGVQGTEMTVRTPLDGYSLRSPLVGDYNCENVLAAAAVAFALDVPVGAVRRALAHFEGVPGRLERVDMPGREDLPGVFVDYAHTPNALSKVLTTLRPLAKGRLICVFGCGGDREREKRPLMGDVATSVADLTVITSDNSRSERTEDIIAQIEVGIDGRGPNYTTEPDRRRAIEIALAAARPGDVVALCGRGCERFQLLGDRRIPFDDRIVARKIMQSLWGERRLSA